MHTTGGLLALADARGSDAHLVTRLRDAGALIIGKTNLSEWANFRSSSSSSGWSGRGGQTRNPYALDRSTSGSSSGTAAALAAGLAALGVGTETDGSIISPASIYRSSRAEADGGCISRSGVIPISHAGPPARCDAHGRRCALLCAAMLGRPDDPMTRPRRRTRARPMRCRRPALGPCPATLRGAWLGMARAHFTGFDEANALISRRWSISSASAPRSSTMSTCRRPSYGAAGVACCSTS